MVGLTPTAESVTLLDGGAEGRSGGDEEREDDEPNHPDRSLNRPPGTPPFHLERQPMNEGEVRKPNLERIITEKAAFMPFFLQYGFLLQLVYLSVVVDNRWLLLCCHQLSMFHPKQRGRGRSSVSVYDDIPSTPVSMRIPRDL